MLKNIVQCTEKTHKAIESIDLIANRCGMHYEWQVLSYNTNIGTTRLHSMIDWFQITILSDKSSKINVEKHSKMHWKIT